MEITIELGKSSSGIREDKGEGVEGPREGKRELSCSASGLDTNIRLESSMVGSTSNLAGWKLEISGILI